MINDQSGMIIDDLGNVHVGYLGTPYSRKDFWDSLISLAPLKEKKVAPPITISTDNTGIPDMYYDNRNAPQTTTSVAAIITKDDPTDKQRKHILEAAYVSYKKHDMLLNKAFFIKDEDPPQTIKEYKDRVAKGLFIFDTRDIFEDSTDDGREYLDWALRWRDPSKNADHPGYNNAWKILHKAYEDLQLDIQVFSPEDGLKRLREFEAKSFT